MSIIAVRRNLSANALFFRQVQNHIFSSLDGVNYSYAFSLPVTPTGIGNDTWDFSKGDQYYIDIYNNKNDQDININLLVNGFPPPTTRTDGIARADQINNSMYDPQRLCYAYFVILQTARDLKLAVQNGQLEPDDAERAKDFAKAFPFVGGLVSSAITASVDLLNLNMQLTDEQIANYACCMYNATRLGDFSFTQWKTVGTNCGLGAWDEIATAEMYGAFCAIMTHDRTKFDCPCEYCEDYLGTGYQVTRGERTDTAVTTQSYNIGGNVYEMQSQVTFKIPLQVINSIEVWHISVPYENTYTPRPSLVFNAPNTGGGTTAITNPYFLGRTMITPAHLPLLPVDTFQLTHITSVCSACTTAQTTEYNKSFGTLFKVYVCGTLA